MNDRIRPLPEGRRNSSGFFRLLLLLLSFFAAGTLFGQEGEGSASSAALQNLANRIAEKRAELESLSDELEIAKSEISEELRSLSTQTADVEALINREELRLSQIESDIDERRSEIRRAEESTIDLSPLLRLTMEGLRDHISSGIPFERTRRLQAVATVERLLEEGSLNEQTALTRLWNLVDSEFRLVGDMGIYRQRIDYAGEPRLAEVARLGMVLLYFRTFEGEFGYAVREGGEWSYRRVRDSTEEEQVAALFEGLRRNLRQGFFTVPNPYAGGN